MNETTLERSSGLCQPLLGIMATGAIITTASLFISIFSEPVFSSWIAFLLMCCVPVQIVCGLVWGCSYPEMLTTLTTSKRGLLLTIMTIAGGLVIAAIIFSVIAQGVTPPGPQHNIFIITFIVVMFWVVAAFNCEPLASFIKKPLPLGLAVLLLCFSIACVIFYFGMNFQFIAGAPVYHAHMDGKGAFMAFDLLTTLVTSVAFIMAFIQMDFWPVKIMPGSDSKAGHILWTTLLLVILAVSLRYLFVSILGMDQIVFMTMIPIPFIFGTFIVLNLFQGSFYPNLTGATKGFAFCATSALFATVIYPLFSFIGPLASGVMTSGAPSYQLDFWVANAMLSVSFPLIVAYSEFFQHWPLQRNG